MLSGHRSRKPGNLDQVGPQPRPARRRLIRPRRLGGTGLGRRHGVLLPWRGHRPRRAARRRRRLVQGRQPARPARSTSAAASNSAPARANPSSSARRRNPNFPWILLDGILVRYSANPRPRPRPPRRRRWPAADPASPATFRRSGAHCSPNGSAPASKARLTARSNRRSSTALLETLEEAGRNS